MTTGGDCKDWPLARRTRDGAVLTGNIQEDELLGSPVRTRLGLGRQRRARRGIEMQLLKSFGCVIIRVCM